MQKQALSPRLLDEDGGPAVASMIDEAKSSAPSSDGILDGVRIVLPPDSAADAYEPTGHPAGGVPSLSAAPESPVDREAFFSSWLSENYESRQKVLIIDAEDLKARLRDPLSTLPSDSSSGELRFRGDLFVDWLMKHFNIEHRATAIVASQRLLENNLIAPVETPVFLDKRIEYTLG